MACSIGGESSSSSDTINSTSKWEYDVFLSFAGKDTRLNFTGHLYNVFIRSGVRCFRDDVDLEKGGDIKQDLFQAIEDSLCAVVIISKNYANSTWALDELQRILELGQRVYPIFYDIDPSDVRHQRKSFGEAMAKHEEKFEENTTKVQNWRNALLKIANLSGWDTRRKHEADLINNIVGAVWTYLSSKLPSYYDNLVGIDSRVGDMMPILEIGLDDMCFVGIWGMGGVGKTTLARVVFKKISDKFEICCFLANVRETLLQSEGLVSLQKKLLSHLKIRNMEISDHYDGMERIRKLLCNKKVLLVLDDVDDMSQLENLAESPYWFGKGSRIIITTRDSHFLTTSKVQRIYEMKTMKEDESLQLFSNKAFHKNHPERDYLELSESVVKYTRGLPLALKVLGLVFCGRRKAEWIDILDRLKQIPDNNKILQVLKISYDGLKNEEEKTIFLDIACFFNGWPKKEVIQILKSCDLHPKIGMKILIEKALLVETEDCRLDMHHLLVDLGRYIVYQQSPDVGQRSRLWKLEDVKEVLEHNKGSEAIQAIVLQDYYRDPSKIEVHPEAFSKMSNIRLLLLSHSSPLILPRGLKLSGALKVVEWPSFTLEALPLEIPLDKLVYISMWGSKIKRLWNGIQFKKLKFIDLSYSLDFTETPDFSGVPYLEHLCLHHCTSLVKIHHSLGMLRKLVEVYLDHCENLEILPRKFETNSLRMLDLSWCKKVVVLPEFEEGMKNLKYIDARGTAITRLPESLGHLTSLRCLNLSGCNILNLDSLLKTPITCQISGLLNATSLTELYLSGCGLNDGSIPDDFGNLSSLIVLDLSDNNFVNLPTGCFSSLFRLAFLSLDRCERLKSLPRLPPQLIRLNASCCFSMEPLSDRPLWNLVASFDPEYRGRTKYVFKHVEGEFLSPRDFCVIMSGHEIPSWFPNKEYYSLDENRGEYGVMKVNIPRNSRDSEWSGIVVCLHVLGFSNLMISWSSKAPEDDDYIFQERTHFTPIMDNWKRHLCIMVLELNEKTCWQHLRGHNNSLHIKLRAYNRFYSMVYSGPKLEILGCGWRVLCKEDIKEWCNLNHFNQLTHPQLASPHEVKLTKRVFDRFTKKVTLLSLIEDPEESDEENQYMTMTP